MGRLVSRSSAIERALSSFAEPGTNTVETPIKVNLSTLGEATLNESVTLRTPGSLHITNYRDALTGFSERKYLETRFDQIGKAATGFSGNGIAVRSSLADEILDYYLPADGEPRDFWIPGTSVTTSAGYTDTPVQIHCLFEINETPVDLKLEAFELPSIDLGSWPRLKKTS